MNLSEAVFAPQEVDSAFVLFRDESRFWVQRVLLPIIGTMGVFGNIATILVLTRRGMRTSTNAYLTALAVSDLIYLICVLWLSLHHYPYVNEDPLWSFIYSHVWPYSLYLADATTNTSVWLTVTFTVERCIAIANPIKGRVVCTVSRAKKVIIGVYFLCFISTMTTPLEWTVVESTDPVTHASIFEIASSTLGRMEIYKTIYYWFISITFVLLPLTLLIIFNSFLVYSFHQSQKLRQIMTVRRKVSNREERAATHETRITSTLITVVIMFLVCQLPTAATLIYKISLDVSKMTPNEEAVLRALGNIFNFLVSLNASCNFILYCSLSKQYRRTFMSTFFQCLYRPSSSAHSKAFLPHHVEGPKGVRFNTRRRSSSSSSSSSRRNRNSFMTSNPTGPSQKCFSRLQRAPLIRLKTDNGFSSSTFSHSCCTQTIIAQYYPSFVSTVPDCSSHQSRQSLLFKRSPTNVVKKRSLESTPLVFSSLPNIWSFYNPSSLKYSCKMTATKSFSVSSSSA